MSIEISLNTESRLVATAQAERISVNTSIEQLIEEREGLGELVLKLRQPLLPPVSAGIRV
jgi:hypothetical protein